MSKIRSYSKIVTDWDALPVALDVKTVSDILHVTGATVGNLIKRGKISAGNTGKAWAIDRDSVKAFVRGKNQQNAAAESTNDDLENPFLAQFKQYKKIKQGGKTS